MEKTPTKQISVRISESCYRSFRIAVIKNGSSNKEVIEKLLESYIQNGLIKKRRKIYHQGFKKNEMP